MRLVLVALFVCINFVICITDSDKSAQARQSFNHPPSAEDYHPIPVSVVYEDDVIDVKSKHKSIVISSEAESEKQSTTEKSQLLATEEMLGSVAIQNDNTEVEKNNHVRTYARAISEVQIPVAVIYDNIPEKNLNLQTPNQKGTNIRRRKYKHISTRKQLRSKTTAETETSIPPNTEPTLAIIETHTRTIESARRNPSHIETKTKDVKTKRVRDPVVPIVQMENYVFAHSGNFHYSYEGGDGTKAHSQGQLRSIDQAAGEAVSGGFSYTGKDGHDISLSYTADEHGYRPTGAHLPTPPPIPPAIVRLLEYLSTATTPEPVTKPSVKRTEK